MHQTGCVSDLRKHRRIETRRTARLSIDDAWHDCVLLDVSEGGAKLVCDLEVVPGMAVVLAEEALGLLAGVVQRSDDDGVSLTFGVNAEARRSLIGRLVAFFNGA